MIKSLPPYLLVLSSIAIASACSAQTESPSDQVIEGKFDITNEWKTIVFDQPLISEPHVQLLELVFCNKQMSLLLGDPDNPISEEDKGSFIRTSDEQLFKPELMIRIDSKNYALYQSSTAFYHTGQFSDCRSIGYGLDEKDNDNALFLPEDTRIASVTLRSNLAIDVDFLYWVSPYFERAPNADWSTTHPSKIIDLEGLALE